MTDENDRGSLIEEVAGAWRPLDPRRLRYHAAWYDLDEDSRERAHALAEALRPLEAALHPEGRSPTVLSVLARIRRSD